MLAPEWQPPKIAEPRRVRRVDTEARQPTGATRADLLFEGPGDLGGPHSSAECGIGSVDFVMGAISRRPAIWPGGRAADTGIGGRSGARLLARNLHRGYGGQAPTILLLCLRNARVQQG